MTEDLTPKGDEEKKRTKDLIKLYKAQTEYHHALRESESSLAILGNVFTLAKPLEPVFKIIGDFFSIIAQAFQAGLGDALQKFAEALFTDKNIEILTNLGTVFGDLASMVLPLLSSALNALMPLFKLLADVIEGLLPLIQPIIDFFTGLTTAFGDWLGSLVGGF